MATDTATFEKTTTTPDVDNVDAPDSGPAEPTADEVAERVFAATVAGYEALSVYVGDRLGWYSALKDRGPATASELAGLTATHERYAREWLEQQSVMGILRLDGYSSSGQQRFALPSGAAEALTDTDSLAYLAPLPRMLAASGSQLPEILDAYRHGDGVSWEEFGADARDSQADINKPWFLHALPDALRGVEEVDAVLRRPGARILDVGSSERDRHRVTGGTLFEILGAAAALRPVCLILCAPNAVYVYRTHSSPKQTAHSLHMHGR